MTAQVTVYADAGITVGVIAGAPPADQSATVAQLTADLASANAALVSMTSDRDAQVQKLAAVKAKAALLDTSDAAQDQIRADIHGIVG